MFDFRRITLFCLEKHLSKHKMAIFSNNFGEAMALPGYAYVRNVSRAHSYLNDQRTPGKAVDNKHLRNLPNRRRELPWKRFFW